MDMCYRGELKANVERTPETILITIPPRMGGFTEIRFNIKSDGTGGIREVKEGSEWKPDEYRRDLTL